jgi:hypothetical protein
MVNLVVHLGHSFHRHVLWLRHLTNLWVQRVPSMDILLNYVVKITKYRILKIIQEQGILCLLYCLHWFCVKERVYKMTKKKKKKKAEFYNLGKQGRNYEMFCWLNYVYKIKWKWSEPGARILAVVFAWYVAHETELREIVNLICAIYIRGACIVTRLWNG